MSEGNGNMNLDDIKQLLDNGFRQKVIGHRVAHHTIRILEKKLLTSGGQKVIALVGPSGIGKSRVFQKLTERMSAHYNEYSQANPGLIPFISMVAHTGIAADFNWKDFFNRLLVLAKEPLLGLKLTREAMLFRSSLRNSSRSPAEEARSLFEVSVDYRKILHLLIDEASAMFDANLNKRVDVNYNLLKTLAKAKNLNILLCSAYDLLQLRDANGQIQRISELVHMERYQVGHRTCATESDTLPDEEVYWQYAELLAESCPVILAPCMKEKLRDGRYLIQKTVGCFGNLFAWLDRSAITALSEHRGVLTSAVFEAHASENSVLIRLIQEAKLGEKLLQDKSDDELIAAYEKEVAPETPVGQETKGGRGRGGRIGLRGPSRDPVGH